MDRSSKQKRSLPPATVAQMVLVPLMICILVACWFAPRDGEKSNREIFLTNRKPIIAVLGTGFVRFVDCEKKQELGEFAFSSINPAPPRATSSEWHRWPSAANLSNRKFENQWWLRDDRIEFDCLMDDSISIFSQGSLFSSRRHTIVHLPTGKQNVHDELPRTNFGPIEFANVDNVVVGVQRQSGPNAFDAPIAHGSQKSIVGEVVLVIDPLNGPTELSAEQKKRVLNAFAVRRWQYDRWIYSDDPIDMPLADQETAKNDANIEFCDRVTRPGRWTTRSGLQVEYSNQGSTQSDSTSKYWLIDSSLVAPRQATWPFRRGEAFERTAYVPNEPAVCGIVRSVSFPALKILERPVYWNLETGKVIPLKAAVHDVRQFEDRLLLVHLSGATWIDLKTNKSEQRIIAAASPNRTRFTFAVAIWLVAWLALVRPADELDLSRRFGAYLLVLGVAAISISQLNEIGLNYDWPQVEWLASCSLIMVLLAILLTVTIRRCVSWLLLGAAWSIVLFLTISLAIESGAETDETTRNPTIPGAWSYNSVRMSLWQHLLDPDGFNRALLDPAETPFLSTTSDNEPHFGVKRIQD